MREKDERGGRGDEERREMDTLDSEGRRESGIKREVAAYFGEERQKCRFEKKGEKKEKLHI